jgi:hypothetical protein
MQTCWQKTQSKHLKSPIQQRDHLRRKETIRAKKKGARRSRIFFSTKTTTQELENPWNPIQYSTVMIPDSLQNPQNL